MMVRGDRRLTTRLISDELELNQNTIGQIITEDLRICKVCAKIVPRWFHIRDHPQHPHILFWIFCDKEKLLNETKSALCRFVEACRKLLQEIFSNAPEI